MSVPRVQVTSWPTRDRAARSNVNQTRELKENEHYKSNCSLSALSYAYSHVAILTDMDFFACYHMDPINDACLSVVSIPQQLGKPTESKLANRQSQFACDVIGSCL